MDDDQWDRTTRIYHANHLTAKDTSPKPSPPPSRIPVLTMHSQKRHSSGGNAPKPAKEQSSLPPDETQRRGGLSRVVDQKLPTMGVKLDWGGGLVWRGPRAFWDKEACFFLGTAAHVRDQTDQTETVTCNYRRRRESVADYR